MVVYLYAMAPIMSGIKILNQEKANLFQGTLKLKMAWLKE